MPHAGQKNAGAAGPRDRMSGGGGGGGGGWSFERCAAVLALFTGDAGPDPREYVRFVYVSAEYLEDASDPDEGPLLSRLLDKVEGAHYDACRGRQLQRVDMMFEWLEKGLEHGWATEQRWTTRPRPPGAVTRIVVVTADAQ